MCTLPPPHPHFLPSRYPAFSRCLLQPQGDVLAQVKLLGACQHVYFGAEHVLAKLVDRAMQQVQRFERLASIAQVRCILQLMLLRPPTAFLQTRPRLSSLIFLCCRSCCCRPRVNSQMSL